MPHTTRHGRPAAEADDQGALYSTTEGRQRFPDFLQTTFGNKAVIGFGRYGRALGAVVPIEAVRVLAGFPASVDEDIRRRIQRTAESLLKKLPVEAALCGLDGPDTEPKLTEIAEVDARRKARGRRKVPAQR